MKYFVYVDDILGVKTNANAFEWSYGTVAPESNLEKFNRCKIKLYINVKRDDDVFPLDKGKRVLGKFHYFSGNPDERTIYYERNYFFGKWLRYMIQVEDNTRIKVTVGKTYFTQVKHRIMNLHSLGYTLTDLISGILLLNGYATLHCSAVNFKENNHSVILFAPPNTGKTLTSIMLCKNHNANFIAEDFAVTDGENIWAVPWTSTFRLYDEINESKSEKALNKITSVIPALELVKITKNKPINEYIGEDRILLKSKATDIAVLERGEYCIDHANEDALRKLLVLNRYEFNYHKSPAMVVFNYWNPEYSQVKMYEKEKEILENLLDNVRYICVKDMDAANYSDIIYKEIVDKKAE